jgi:hypothetical protein
MRWTEQPQTVRNSAAAMIGAKTFFIHLPCSLNRFHSSIGSNRLPIPLPVSSAVVQQKQGGQWPV